LSIAKQQADTLGDQLREARAARENLDELLNGQKIVVTSLATLNDLAAQIRAIVAASSVPRPTTVDPTGSTGGPTPVRGGGTPTPQPIPQGAELRAGFSMMQAQLIALNATNEAQAEQLAEMAAAQRRAVAA
jgi:hypothetical protein